MVALLPLVCSTPDQTKGATVSKRNTAVMDFSFPLHFLIFYVNFINPRKTFVFHD